MKIENMRKATTLLSERNNAKKLLDAARTQNSVQVYVGGEYIRLDMNMRAMLVSRFKAKVVQIERELKSLGVEL